MKYLNFLKNFKFYYKDVEEIDSTSRLTNSLRPFVLAITAISVFILFEEDSTNIDRKKDQTLWTSKFYRSQKENFNCFKLRILDIIPIDKTK